MEATLSAMPIAARLQPASAATRSARSPTGWRRPNGITPTCPRKQMKELMQRSDGPAIRDTIIWLALFAAFGAGGAWFWGTWWCVPFFFVYGVLYGSSTDSAAGTNAATAPPSRRSG